MKKILNNIPDWQFFETCKRVTEKDILLVEKKINYKFPQDYRYFLLKYNWCSYGEIYWIRKKNNTKGFFSEILNMFYNPWYFDDIFDQTKKNQKLKYNPMPKYLIPFSPNWRGDNYCFNLNDNWKIYFWQHDLEEWSKNPDFDNNTFTEWLENSVNDFIILYKNEKI